MSLNELASFNSLGANSCDNCASCSFCVKVHNLEGERERLNQRILVFTEQLADAKFTNSMETLNVSPFSCLLNVADRLEQLGERLQWL